MRPKNTIKFDVAGHGVCDNLAKSVTLPVATQEVRVIAKQCITLVRGMRITPSDFRGVGNSNRLFYITFLNFHNRLCFG